MQDIINVDYFKIFLRKCLDKESKFDSQKPGHIERATETIEKIERALHRIETGEFGGCVSCGSNIGLGQLTLDPTLEYCTKCQPKPSFKIIHNRAV